MPDDVDLSVFREFIRQDVHIAEMMRKVQGRAFYCRGSGKVLKWLMHEGFYDKSFNSKFVITYCRNIFGWTCF